jgi:antitoxin PrlF
MLATLTSKGQLTLPKDIRDQLSLKAGSRLDFHINAEGWLLARPVTNTALGLAGLLKRPGQAAVSVDAMNEAVLATAAMLNPTPKGAAKVGAKASTKPKAPKAPKA